MAMQFGDPLLLVFFSLHYYVATFQFHLSLPLSCRNIDLSIPAFCSLILLQPCNSIYFLPSLELNSLSISLLSELVKGLQQRQGMVVGGALPVGPAAGLRPSMQVPAPQADSQMQSIQKKSSVPVLEKHLVNQLSKEEQNSLNSKYQEATEADKKALMILCLLYSRKVFYFSSSTYHSPSVS